MILSFHSVSHLDASPLLAGGTGGQMIRRRALTAAVCLAAPWPVRTRGQTRVRRLGVIYPGVDRLPGSAAFWKRLGWIEGETLLIERR